MATKTVDGRPILFYNFDAETGQISISAYKYEDSEWENNHIELCEIRNGKVNKHESITNILRNVVALADIYLELDD